MNASILSDLVITRVHSASTMFSPKDKKGKRNDRSGWAVILKYEGETVYTANGKRYLSDANHPIVLPKGCSYEWECTKAGHFVTVEFDCESRADRVFPFSIKSHDKLLKQIKELESKRNAKPLIMELESLRDVYSILLTLAQSEAERYLPTQKQQKIAPAIEYVTQNYRKTVTNDELAALTGLSNVYFRKLFTECMGVSPILYARSLRIEKAKELLKSDYGTLSDVAQYLGYPNLYDFSRDFKKHTGVPPSKFELGD